MSATSPPPTSPLLPAPGSLTRHYPAPPASYHRRASLDTSNHLSDVCAAALILGLSRGDREDVEEYLRLEMCPWGIGEVLRGSMPGLVLPPNPSPSP